ncbi:hypothetical protein [Dongia sedimenti]|uniref:TIGR03016 family PEP-CTERM system-associated outer membrane protein n=1 Tax=Dongia sedimenti TaxID=3064282 RepID=A0ABU0YR56_9PROT|nr:hypothetical protein [Rhodospirillaceae bacterium R-7]
MAIGRRGLRGVNRALALAFGLLAFGVLALCFEARTALAQDWSFESSLSQRMGYNSNVLLQPSDEISAFSSQTTPDFTLSRSGPTSNVSLNGRFEFTEYFAHSDLNSADQFGKLNLSKAFSERSTLQFSGAVDRDTTLESDEDATGRFVNEAIRFVRWDASPTWQYLLSPIDKVSVSARYLRVSYDSSDKTDYQDYGPTVTYSHDLSELASVYASLNYSRFEPDEQRNDLDAEAGTQGNQDTYGGLLGYDYHPTERFTIGGAAGLNYNVTHQDGQKDSGEIGYRFQFTMNYQINDQTNADVSLSRDTEPTGDGEERTRNRGSVRLGYKMTEMTSFALDTSYIDDQETQSNDGVARYLTVTPSVQWSITEELSLQATYQFRYKNVESDGSAYDNAAFITLRYALPDFNWSGF